MSTLPRLEVDELLNEAIMSSTPVVIVEGYDDISIYQNLADSVRNDIEVYASENIPRVSKRYFSLLNSLSWSNVKPSHIHFFSFSYQLKRLKKTKNGKEGCDGVVNCILEIKYLADTLNEDIEYEKHILGIIDRDASIFRQDPNRNIKGLFILNSYSIESHYVTKDIIPNIINNLSMVPYTSIDSTLIDLIYANIMSSLSELYYLSLDALKNACEINYNSIFSYSEEGIVSIIKNTNYANRNSLVMQRKNDLDAFASILNISNKYADILLITKGKWLLDYFIYKLDDEMKAMKDLCNNSIISQCQYCQNSSYDKCLYKVKSFNNNSVKNFVLNEKDLTSLDYVKDKILTLG